MNLRSTVDVVWREGRGAWVVEGGDGRTAVLGICSVHDTRDAAVDAAADLAEEFGARVRVLNRPGDDWPPFLTYDLDRRPDGGSGRGSSAR